ncbi:hypothetical protein RhiirC2_710882 [Rhizophagus irregularis]|uniref:Uncharacterized protein n=1 Tax=Rhizophagus irregularis TaxID=588596 RepID=A0A2N1NCY8_9GLOM|nr:hypothetical protein RhiirC2_710882 [Rhizophagus irregularis]
MTLVFLIIVVDDIGKSSNQNIENTSRISNVIKAGSKKLSKVFKKLKINSKNDINNYYDKETTRQKPNVDIDDEVHNNPNLHSEEQDELEIPDGHNTNYKDTNLEPKVIYKNYEPNRRYRDDVTLVDRTKGSPWRAIPEGPTTLIKVMKVNEQESEQNKIDKTKKENSN